MTATLEISGCVVNVKLRNLSSDGAQIESETLPVDGTQLLFRKGEITVAGQIIWTKGKQAGILFEERLEPDTVLNQVPVPKPRRKVDFRRPGLASRALTEQERKLAERWIAISPGPSISD